MPLGNENFLSTSCGEAHQGANWKSILEECTSAMVSSEMVFNREEVVEFSTPTLWDQKCHIKKKVGRFENGVPVPTLREKNSGKTSLL